MHSHLENIVVKSFSIIFQNSVVLMAKADGVTISDEGG